MDGEEKEAVLPDTERVERLTMSAVKHVVDVSGQDDVKAQFDAEAHAEDADDSPEYLISENSQNAVNGLTPDDGIDCNSETAESGFSMVENVAEVSSSPVANGSESACVESATEPPADSVTGSSVEAADYTVQTSDLQFAVDDNTGDNMPSIKSSDLSFETLNRDISDILNDESSLHSAKESAEVDDMYDSVVGANSCPAVLSDAELCDTQLTETADPAADGSLHSKFTSKGKHVSNF